jgi:hypothetical protein
MTRLNSLRSLDNEVLLLVDRSVAYLEKEAGRVNWQAVLERLPRQFRASQVRTVRGLKNKRPSEIFAAITRWTEAGSVKRKERGLYERVQQSLERRPKKPA